MEAKLNKYVKKNSAKDLSSQWDYCIDEYYQSKEFLLHLETYNFCNQRYYEGFIDSTFVVGAVVYEIRTNIFTFSKINLPFQLVIIGLPVSVSPQGLIGNSVYFEQLVNYILTEEKGIVQIQNADADLHFSKMISMRAMPCVELHLPPTNFNNYLDTFRYPYRRRIKQALKYEHEIVIIKTKCIEFTQAHYQLYIDVMNATQTRLETLSFDSFKYLPDNFLLTTLIVKEGILSWNITCKDKKVSFYFGGLSYILRDTYKGYYNNLISIIKEAYACNQYFVELGQTAELPKIRLGGTLKEKQLFIYHKYKVYCFLFWLFKRNLGYYKREKQEHIFK